MTPAEIAQQLPVTIGTVWRHLEALEDAGVAEEMPNSKWAAIERDPDVWQKSWAYQEWGNARPTDTPTNEGHIKTTASARPKKMIKSGSD